MKRIITRVLDDLDGTEGATTHTFALDGRAYAIDLTDDNFAALVAALEPYLEAGRRQTGGKRAPAWHYRSGAAVAPRAVTAGARAVVTTLPPAVNASVVRSWWKTHPDGLPPWKANGVLPPTVKAAWAQHLARAETINGTAVL